MPVQPVAIYGGGGHAKVVIDIARTRRDLRLVGILDDGRASGTRAASGLEVLGGASWLQSGEAVGVAIALAVGNNSARAHIAELCAAAGAELVTLVHPSAVVSDSAEVGPGTVIMPGAVVNTEARIGRGAIINSGAIVEHDCFVGDFAHVSPRAAMGGGARLGAGSHLGLGAVILPGTHVGEGSVVGAGAVVVSPLPSGVVAVGVPARVRRQA